MLCLKLEDLEDLDTSIYSKTMKDYIKNIRDITKVNATYGLILEASISQSSLKFQFNRGHP
jgi:hypothetical protein